MVSPASGVNFGVAGAMDRVSQEQLYSPGLYALPQVMADIQPPHRKKDGGFLGFIGKLILLTAAVGGGAVALRKTALKNITVLEKMPEGSKKLAVAKNYVAKFADWVETSTKKLIPHKKTVSEAGDSVEIAKS